MSSPSIERVSALRLLSAICRTGQLSTAAQLIGLTPSGASHVLNEVKKQLKDPLFNRTGSGLAPSPLMEKIFPRIEAILTSIDTLTRFDEFDPAEVRETFRICAYDNAFMAFLLEVIPDIKAQAPKMNLEIKFVPDIQTLIGDLRSGQVSLAIHTRPSIRSDIVVQELPQLDFILLCRKGHPLVELSRERSLSENDLMPFVQLAPGDRPSPMEPRPWERMRQKGMSTIVQPYFNVSPFLVLNTDYLGWIPKITAQKWMKIASFSIVEPPETLRIAVVPKIFWSRRFNLNPLNQWVRTKIIAAARDQKILV